MPLILLCGYPSSGKSQCVEKLKEYFSEKRGKKVHVVGDESVGVDRNAVYACTYLSFILEIRVRLWRAID